MIDDKKETEITTTLGIAFVSAVIALIVVAFVAQDCLPQASSAEAITLRGALVHAYERHLNKIVDHAHSCDEALIGLAEEQADWQTTWKEADAGPDPMVPFHCGDAGHE